MDKNCAKTISEIPQIHSKIRENALAAGAPPQTPLGNSKHNYINESLPWNLL